MQLPQEGNPEFHQGGYVNFVSNEPARAYVFASSHVASKMSIADKRRSGTALVWALWLLLQQRRTATTCSTDADPHRKDVSRTGMIGLRGLLLMAFWIGRFTKTTPQAKAKTVTDTENEKDGAIVPQRLRTPQSCSFMLPDEALSLESKRGCPMHSVVEASGKRPRLLDCRL